MKVHCLALIVALAALAHSAGAQAPSINGTWSGNWTPTGGVPERRKIQHRDRLFWIALKSLWKEWKSALVIVRPETVISWQRNRSKQYSWRLSQPKCPALPRVSAKSARSSRSRPPQNPLWGAPRVHGELKLGFEISERTVSRLIVLTENHIGT